jgi:hypothetical protein
VQVACNQRGRNASQLNIGGTGLGSFNDRFRDALMGGSPFASPRYQGYVTGLQTQPNSFTQVHQGRPAVGRVFTHMVEDNLGQGRLEACHKLSGAAHLICISEGV